MKEWKKNTKRGHNELWSEMKEMIHEYGGKNYIIFLDKETLELFDILEFWDETANTAICRKRWDYMSDIMDINPDNSPVSKNFKNVFYLD